MRESDNLLSGKQLGMKLIINYERCLLESGGKKKIKISIKIKEDDIFIYRL